MTKKKKKEDILIFSPEPLMCGTMVAKRYCCIFRCCFLSVLEAVIMGFIVIYQCKSM